MVDQETGQKIRQATSIKVSQLIGAGLLLGFVFGFGYWAGSAPLKGAVVASGWVTKEGRTQTILHERGGVISKINFREGERVKRGDVLVLIEDADRKSEKEQIENQIAFLSVKEVRLMAEEAGTQFDADHLTPKLGELVPEEAVTQLVTDQKKEFKTRRALLVQEADILKKQKETMKQELRGVSSELKSLSDWRDILKEQVAVREQLLEKGAVSKVVIQETKKHFAEVDSDYQRLKAKSETIPHRIDEVDAYLDRIEGQFAEKVAKELAELRTNKRILEKRLQAAQRAVARVALRAPTNGQIDKLYVNTLGSAVAAFQPIVEIVPEQNPILVEVRIAPQDIEQVTVGQDAKLMLSAFDLNEVAPVKARVKFVSPNHRLDQATQMPFFVARLEINDEQDQELPNIVPGMPIEAYMETQERTFLQMMIEPITKSIQRSFRS